MKKFYNIILPLFLLCSCAGKLTVDIPAEANGYLASVLKAGGGKTTVYLTDYFPGLDGVDSITVPAGTVVTPSADGWEIFDLDTKSMAGVLGTLSVWKNGQKLNIALDASPAGDLTAGVPHIFTTGHDAESIKLGFTAKPEKVVALWQNVELGDKFVSVSGDAVTVKLPGNIAGTGRSYIRVFAAAGDKIFSDVLVPLSDGKVVDSAKELDRHDPHTQILYSLMIDRFYNGNPSNDWKINSPDVLPQVDYQGGDIKGITEKIREGFFNDLGITTIWISPITQNPYSAWGLNKDPYTRFSGYHGYWPLYITAIDKRFATKEELDEMLAAAHEHGLNVILDYVANHMHIDSPVLKAHPDWVTPLDLPDGRKNIALWDEHRLTTWFDTHIPSLDLGRPEIYEPLTDSALYWIANFDFDGFRHDATKHIPEAYWRTLTAKMKERFPDRKLYQIGETYGSPQLIGSYVKSGMLDAQFDFNLYDRSIWNIGNTDGDMKEIAGVINESLNYYGYHNLMGNITGNHDRPRFISLAGGALMFDEDHKAAGWKRDVTVGDPSGYSKLSLLEALIMTIPGVPCVYQGDEYGVPGGNDPDNRRMMQFGGYSAKEQATLDNLKKLTRLRNGSMPLLYGDMIPLYNDKDVYVFSRIYMGEPVVVILNRSGEAGTAVVTPPAGIDFGGLGARFGNGSAGKQENGTVTLTVAPVSFEIFTIN